MTTKNNTLLRHGIHSELFLLAYVHPDTGYGIAKRHQNIERKPDTSKTSKALDRLEKTGYLELKNKKYHPNIEMLFADLSEYLKSKHVLFDENESKVVKEMLEQNFIFIYLGQDIMYRIFIQPLRIHHIDALEVLSNHMGMMCTFYKMMKNKNMEIISDEAKRKSVSKMSEEIDVEILKIREDMKKSFKGSKAVRKKKMSELDEINSLMKSFILSSKIFDKSSTDTLEKLENLWDQRDGFQIGLSVSDSVKSLFDVK